MKHLKPFESADDEDIKNIFIDLFDEFSNLEFKFDISEDTLNVYVVSRLFQNEGGNIIRTQRKKMMDITESVRVFLDEETTHRMCDIGYSNPEVNLTSSFVGYRIVIKFYKIK